MQQPKRTVTREYVLHTSRQVGLNLSEQRIDELVPVLQVILDGLESVRKLVEKTDVEPAPTFRVMEG